MMIIIFFAVLSISLNIFIYLIGPSTRGTFYTSSETNFFGIKSKNIFNDEKLDCSFFLDIIKYADNFESQSYYKSFGKKCKRFKIMTKFEYSSVIFSILLGIMYLVFEIKKDEKITSIISIIFTLFGIVVTSIYVGYNGYIFNNDTTYSYFGGFIIKTDSNGAFAKLDKSTGKYNLLFPMKNEYDFDSSLIKFKDLGQKQYNYDKTFFLTKYLYRDEKFYKCQYDEPSDVYKGKIMNKTFVNKYSNIEVCDYLYSYNYNFNEKSINKDIHDRWLSALILSLITVIIEIILIILDIYCICTS